MFKALRLIAIISVFFASVFFGVPASLFALSHERITSVNDTTLRLRLDSVTITTYLGKAALPNRAFAIGSNIITASQASLQSLKTSSLADFLRVESAAYLKEYGRGMGAFVSVRGTSSSHTSVLWNGMSVAIPTMGQTDLSHIPVYFFERMDLHIGGGSVLYGDGSIGGNISLRTAANWQNGLSGDVTLSASSFATFFKGATVRYSNGRQEYRTSVFINSAENNYAFENNTKPGRPVEYLNNAGYRNMGVLQEVYIRTQNRSQLTLNMWYLQFNREIQPSVSLNDRPESFASIYDKNFRTSLDYLAFSQRLTYNVRLSYSYDHERYKEDIIAAAKVMTSADLSYVKGGLSIKGGLSAEYTKPQVHSYADSVREGRAYLYLLAKYNLAENFAISAGARYGFVTNSKVPFMPSAEIRYMPLNSYGHTLSLRASISVSSKVPSLNDRYWGGNHLYLKSESSGTAEGGFNYSHTNSNIALDLFATIYSAKVKEWIRWLPAGQVWRPQNVPLVKSDGAEAGMSFMVSAAHAVINATLNYSFTSVKMLEGLWREDPSVGKQLAYQPKHSLRTTLSVKINNNTMFTTISYTGDRTTLDIFDKLPSYTLTDVGYSRKLSLFGEHLTMDAVVRNIFSVSYQNVKFYAMPGINWQLTLRWIF